MMKTSLFIHNSAELWQKETSLPSIPTFSQELDRVLGNDGIQLGSLTELLGLPGAGKTQLCLQLCASVQIPKALGGLDSEAVYIDTNTNFTATRFKEILNASITKCEKLLGNTVINEENALKKLHYVNAFGIEKFCTFMHTLPRFLEEYSNIKLIVIDSIAFPFKVDIPASERTGILFRLMACLQKMAIEKQIAVVLTNEMSTRVGLSGGPIVGSLGDAWAHRCNKRLLLSTPDGDSCNRLAMTLKSNNSATRSFVGRFQITNEGIRDVK